MCFLGDDNLRHACSGFHKISHEITYFFFFYEISYKISHGGAYEITSVIFCGISYGISNEKGYAISDDDAYGIAHGGGTRVLCVGRSVWRLR
jgi:hypothetical protein